MKLQNKFIYAETNKNAAKLVKLVQPLPHCGHILKKDNFYSSPEQDF